MRLEHYSVLALLVVGLLAGCGEPAPAADTAMASEKAACSPEYWDWLVGTLAPKLDRPASEVSDAELDALIAARPASGNDPSHYGVCWSPWYNKYVYGPSLARIERAQGIYLDVNDASTFHDYALFRANQAMTPEIRRNAKALLAIKPKTGTQLAFDGWRFGYDTVVDAVLQPVGLPAKSFYTDVDEPQWQLNDVEKEYLDVLEAARPLPDSDGAWDSWLKDGLHARLFGNGVWLSFVFDTDMPYSWQLAGAEIWACDPVHHPDCSKNGDVYLPEAVRSFLDRYEATRPAALGPRDSAAWMNEFHARVFRAVADRSHHEPIADKTNELVLDVLDEVKPAALEGLFSYQTWLDAYAVSHDDALAHPRVMHAKPCVRAADAEAAASSFAQAAAPADAAPLACSEM